MNTREAIVDVLNQLAALLHESDDAGGWATALTRMRDDVLHDSSGDSITRILGCYGGMGSFNDIVLYKGGTLLREENDEFSRLRGVLYEYCWEWRRFGFAGECGHG